MTPQIRSQLTNNGTIMKLIAAEYADWCKRYKKSHSDWDAFVQERLNRNWSILVLKSPYYINETVSVRPNGLYMNDIQPGIDGEFTVYNAMNSYDVIYSVQYFDEVFTLGDSVEFMNNVFEITSFKMSMEHMTVTITDIYESQFDVELSAIRKVVPVETYKTTGDDKDVYPGEKYYGVSVQASGVSDQIREYIFRPSHKTPSTNRITFRDRDKAVRHFLHNVPVLSKRECMELIGVGGDTSVIDDRILAYVESKVQLPKANDIKA